MQLRLPRCEVIADAADGRDRLKLGFQLTAGLGENAVIVGAQLNAQGINGAVSALHIDGLDPLWTAGHGPPATGKSADIVGGVVRQLHGYLALLI